MEEYQGYNQEYTDESVHSYDEYGLGDGGYRNSRYSDVESSHTFVDLGQRLTYYDDLLRTHKESWKGMSRSTAILDLDELDSQIKELVDHPLAIHTLSPYGGSGDPRPQVVFMLKAPGYREVQYGENRDVSLTSNGDSIKTWMDQILPSVPCYYMYLFPFCLSKLTTDYQGDEKDQPNGTESNGFNKPRLELNSVEKSRFYDYARQRLRILRPKVVMCFGNEIFSCLATGLDPKQKISNFMLKGASEKSRNTCVTASVDKDTKFSLIHCPHPYVYSEAIRKINERSFYTDEDSTGGPSREGKTVIEWQDAFTNLSKLLTKGDAVVGAYDVMMNPEKASEGSVSVQAVLSGEMPAPIKKPEKKKVSLKKPAIESVKPQRGQCRLGQGMFKLENNFNSEAAIRLFKEQEAKRKLEAEEKAGTSQQVEHSKVVVVQSKKAKTENIANWLTGKTVTAETERRVLTERVVQLSGPVYIEQKPPPKKRTRAPVKKQTRKPTNVQKK